MHFCNPRIAAVAAVVLSAASFASSASATTNTIMNGQGLSAKNAKSSGWIDTGWSWTQGDADHTWCPGVGKNYIGYTSTPTTDGHITKVSSSCSGWGSKIIYASNLAGVINPADNWRGAVYNPNASTFDNFSQASAGWNCSDFGC